MKHKNMKIEINAEQPLHEVVAELERLGYREDRYQEGCPEFVITYVDGFYMAAVKTKWIKMAELTTLTELKGMK